MEELHALLDEVRRLQLLICAYSPEPDGRIAPLPVDQATAGLSISPEECGTVIRRLSLEGLVESINEPGARGPQAVRLTDEGLRVLQRMRPTKEM